jgi:Icc-related predicted phosphoesterase
MRLLVVSVSDRVADSLYHDQRHESAVIPDAVISCGDLRQDYLDYLTSTFNVPLFYVRGNHHNFIETQTGGRIKTSISGVNLHRRTLNFKGTLLAGVEGCIRYNQGNFQYTQNEMWLHVTRLLPALLTYRARYGRFLDIFVTHTPPWGINDQTDPAHQGSKAFRWFLQVMKPAYHLHGHIHIYKPGTVSRQIFHKTLVINNLRSPDH